MPPYKAAFHLGLHYWYPGCQHGVAKTVYNSYSTGKCKVVKFKSIRNAYTTPFSRFYMENVCNHFVNVSLVNPFKPIGNIVTTTSPLTIEQKCLEIVHYIFALNNRAKVLRNGFTTFSPLSIEQKCEEMVSLHFLLYQ